MIEVVYINITSYCKRLLTVTFFLQIFFECYLSKHVIKHKCYLSKWGRCGRDRMVVGFTYAIGAHHH